MEWLDRMRSALDYIELNLTDDIDLAITAQMACCSSYHFQRMFSFITGIPLSEYVRRRRMTLAAFELQNTDIKIIDLAYRLGYESPEAFSRAFVKMHGISPSAAHSKGVTLKAYPRISFQISIKGDVEMNYRIEEKAEFEIFGMELETNVVDGQCYKEIPAFWGECEASGECVRLAKAAGKTPDELLDVGATYNHIPDGTMNYMIACIKKPNTNTDWFKVLTIPAQTWAVFSVDWAGDGDDSDLNETWGRIYSEWFPTAGYEHADCDFDLEMYFGSRATKCGVEIWIPVVKQSAE